MLTSVPSVFLSGFFLVVDERAKEVQHHAERSRAERLERSERSEKAVRSGRSDCLFDQAVDRFYRYVVFFFSRIDDTN